MSDDAADEPQEVTASNAARLLSVLLVTPEDDLEGFRKRMLGKTSTVPAERLATVRSLLVRLGGVLLNGDERQWETVIATEGELAPRQGDAVGTTPTALAADARAPSRVGAPTMQSIQIPPPSSPRPSSPQMVAPPPPMRSPAPTQVSSGAGSVWAVSTPTPQQSPSPPPVSPPVSSPPPVSPPRVPPRRMLDDEATSLHQVNPQTLDDADGAQPGPLPFVPGGHSLRETAARELNASAHEPSMDLGSTLGVGNVGAVMSGALPFSRRDTEAAMGASRPPPPPSNPYELASDAPLPELTLEQYASLCATCAEQPHLIAKTHSDYGLPTPRMRELLDQSFQQRFDADPSLKMQFSALVEKYRDWVRRNQTS